MKKKKISRILAAGLVLFALLLVISLKIVLTSSRITSAGRQMGCGLIDRKASPWPSVLDSDQAQKMSDLSIFISPVVRSQASPSESPSGPSGPPLGKNEVRDRETGLAFKFLGTVGPPDHPRAIFLRIGPTEGSDKNTKKYFTLAKGERLSKTIVIIQVGEKSATVRQGQETIDLKVYDVDIKPAGPKPEIRSISGLRT
jgi:hypothetical protein